MFEYKFNKIDACRFILIIGACVIVD